MSRVHCINEVTYSKFNFLERLYGKSKKETSICKPNGLGVVDGNPSDGMVEITDIIRAEREKRAVIRDDGAVYSNISSVNVERLKLGNQKIKPNFFITSKAAREFISEMLGDAALSKGGRTEYCKSNTCSSRPNDPWFLAEQGEYVKAERLFKAKTRNGYDRDIALNNLAWFYATAKDPTFRKAKAKEAIKLAKEVVAIREREWKGRITDTKGSESGPKIVKTTVTSGSTRKVSMSNISMKEFKIIVGAFHHTLAMAYYADGDYEAALKVIEKAKDGWSPPTLQALKELVLKAKAKHTQKAK